MDNATAEKTTAATQIEAQRISNAEAGHAAVSEKVDYDRSGAIDAEKAEHDMTVLQAVKAYPAASWWAFVMSCTIVSSSPWQAGDFSNAAIDHGVVLCVLDGTVHRHKAIRP